MYEYTAVALGNISTRYLIPGTRYLVVHTWYELKNRNILGGWAAHCCCDRDKGEHITGIPICLQPAACSLQLTSITFFATNLKACPFISDASGVNMTVSGSSDHLGRQTHCTEKLSLVTARFLQERFTREPCCSLPLILATSPLPGRPA